MKANNHLLPFENMLTGYFTGKNAQSLNTFIEQESKLIFEQEITVSMADDRLEMMIAGLTAELSKESLGILVTRALESQEVDSQLLQGKTGLTPSLVEAIKKDLVFTNSVPVKSLVKLLKMLNLGMDAALGAIHVTFDKLQTESKSLASTPLSFQPSFRKGIVRTEIGKDFSHLKSDESYLYQNEEALNKYTDRLKELYQTL